MEGPTTPRHRTLTAALARLVPPGAGPGAVEAGADDYVARRLEGGGALARLLAEGLGRLERAGFADLGPDRQDEVLREVERDAAAGGPRFLRLLVLLALEGSFCHPARGGNRGGAGWRFAGFGPDADHPSPSRCRAS
jgi:hypothetical protein